MGGQGSGRWPGFGKTTVEDCLSLDVNKLVKGGWLCPGIRKFTVLTWTNTRTGEKVSSCGCHIDTVDLSFAWIRLSYTIKKTGEDMDYKVSLQTTRPYFGGIRWWFTCPLMGCDRRVGKLYLPPGGRYYGCRHCYDLTYESCQESHKYDALFASIAEDVGITPEMVKRVLRDDFKED